MLPQIFPYVSDIVAFCAHTFWSLLDATGSIKVWLYVIYMLLSFRFILRPIFGWASSSGSDRAEKKRKE